MDNVGKILPSQKDTSTSFYASKNECWKDSRGDSGLEKQTISFMYPIMRRNKYISSNIAPSTIIKRVKIYNPKMKFKSNHKFTHFRAMAFGPTHLLNIWGQCSQKKPSYLKNYLKIEKKHPTQITETFFWPRAPWHIKPALNKVIPKKKKSTGLIILFNVYQWNTIIKPVDFFYF